MEFIDKIVDKAFMRKRERNTERLIECVKEYSSKRNETFKKLLLKSKGNFDHKAVTEAVEKTEDFPLTQALIESDCCTSSALRMKYLLFKTIKSANFSQTKDLDFVKGIIESGVDVNSSFNGVDLCDIVMAKKKDWEGVLGLLLDNGLQISGGILDRTYLKRQSDEEFEDKLMLVMKKGVPLHTSHTCFRESIGTLVNIYNNPNLFEKYLAEVRETGDENLLEKYTKVAKLGIIQCLEGAKKAGTLTHEMLDQYKQLNQTINTEAKIAKEAIAEQKLIRSQASVAADEFISSLRRPEKDEIVK